MTSESPNARASQLEVARTIALNLLSVRQRSEKELRTAMARRNVPADVSEEILVRFSEVGLIDDSSFAAALTASRSGFGLRGKARIRQELQTKGIARHVADEALAGLSREDERQAALTLGRRKMKSLAALEPAVARRRLYGMLARRGFDGGVVAGVVEEVLGECAESDPIDGEI